jgi:hypothetical protein
MATRKKIIPVTNIKAGDIPETDQELEKILDKMERKPKVVKKKTVDRQLEHHELMNWVESAPTPEEMQERADHANAGYPVFVKEEIDDVAANHEPGQMLPEDQAERAANGSGWQGEEIPDEEAGKAALDQHVKKAKMNAKDVLSAQMILDMFDAYHAGGNDATVAEQFGITRHIAWCVRHARPNIVKQYGPEIES